MVRDSRVLYKDSNGVLLRLHGRAMEVLSSVSRISKHSSKHLPFPTLKISPAKRLYAMLCYAVYLLNMMIPLKPPYIF